MSNPLWPEFNDDDFDKLKVTTVFNSDHPLRSQYSEPFFRHAAMIAWWESRHRPGWTHPEITDPDKLVHGLHQHFQGGGTSTFPELMKAYDKADSTAFSRIMGKWAPILLGSDIRDRILVNEPDLPPRFKELGEYPLFQEVQIHVFYEYYYEPIAKEVQRLGLSWDVGYAMAMDRAVVWGWTRAKNDLRKVYDAHRHAGEGAVWNAFQKLDDERPELGKRRQWIWNGQPKYGRPIDAPHAPVKVDPLSGNRDGSGGNDGDGSSGAAFRPAPRTGTARIDLEREVVQLRVDVAGLRDSVAALKKTVLELRAVREQLTDLNNRLCDLETTDPWEDEECPF